MSVENPYRSPTFGSKADSDRICITNYNLAGGPLFFAFLVGPVLLGISLLSTVNVWSSLPEDLQGRRVLWLTFFAVMELAAVVYSMRGPILWVEVGPTLRYAKLTRVHERSWDTVQRIWWDRHNERGPLFIRFASHHALIVQIDDYNEVKVLVPDNKWKQVNAIVSNQRQFRNSPFDDDQHASEDRACSSD